MSQTFYKAAGTVFTRTDGADHWEVAYFFGGGTAGFVPQVGGQPDEWTNSAYYPDPASNPYTGYLLDSEYYHYLFNADVNGWDIDQFSDGSRSLNDFSEFDDLPTVNDDQFRCFGGAAVTSTDGEFIYLLVGTNNMDASEDQYDNMYGKIFVRFTPGEGNPDDQFDDCVRLANHPLGFSIEQQNDSCMAEIPGFIFTSGEGRPTLDDDPENYFMVYDVDDDSWSDVDTGDFPEEFFAVDFMCSYNQVLYVFWRSLGSNYFSSFDGSEWTHNLTLPNDMNGAFVMAMAGFRDQFGWDQLVVIDYARGTYLYDIVRDAWHLSKGETSPETVNVYGLRADD